MIRTNRTLYYPTLLLLSSTCKKTAESLAKLLGISGDTLLRILENECVNWEDLIDLAKKKFGMSKVYLIIDDTIIRKIYSKYIAGSSDNYDPVDKRVCRSLCTVVAMVTDGKIAIPVLHKLWVSKEFTSEDQYQTKSQIAQELIEKIRDKIAIKMVLMDGLYANLDMAEWLDQRGLGFQIRFHSNRKIALDQNNPKDTVAIRECKQLKLIGKKSCKTIQAFWKGKSLYFTVVKRYEKDGSSRLVYQISNLSMLARNHAKAYDRRWPIERFFRTGKQYLGLAHCQSRKKTLQENHIYNVFLAYAILQFERKKHRLKSPEKALHRIKRKNNIPISIHLHRAEQIFGNNESVYA